MKSKFVIFLYFFISLYIYFNREEYRNNPFNSDPSGYYLYLPAVFLYHDVQKLKFYHGINSSYNLNGTDYYGIYDMPDDKKIDKYGIGTSIFELPAFFIAHLYCTIDHRHPDDGYSLPYTVAGFIGCFLWVTFGLYILSLFLRQYFTDGVTAFTLLCIAFGTNLYYYSIFNPAYSHPYSFVAVSCVLFFTDAWYRTFKTKYILWLGIVLALVVMIRPVNIAIAIIPFFWHVYNADTLRKRLRLLAGKNLQIMFALLLFFAVTALQMSYWKAVSGHWIYYSYIGERFNFLKPRIWNGLFSFRKGWFIYTPVAFLGCIGFIPLWRKDKKLVVAPLLFLLIIIYIVFSWEQWWYGGGFGCRPLVDVLPVIALPFAAFVDHVFTLSNKTLKIERLALIFFCILLNLFQTYQSTLSYVAWEVMTPEYYWCIFGKTTFDEKAYQDLLIHNYTADME